MTCATCLGRQRLALDLWPRRRPLYVPCHSCKARRRARWHVAGRVAIVVVSAAFAIALVLALSAGYVAKVAWELKGALGQ